MDGFKVYRLGLIDYQNALKLQLSLLEKRMKEEIEDVLLLLQHPPTFTMGRSGKTEHILSNIEEMLILSLCDFNIKARRIEGLTGVWVIEEKVSSIGVGIKRWITYHGFALNVNTELSYFDMIIPCGIPGAKMTSMKKILVEKENLEMTEVESSIINAFSKVFD